jgi:hypothetical protein
MDLSLADVTSVIDVARRVDTNPLRLAGRLGGFSETEQAAGVPTWAWVVLGLGVGAAVAVVAAPRVQHLLSNTAPWLSQGAAPPKPKKQVFGRWK